MTGLAIISASAAVTRALSAMIEVAGYQHVAPAQGQLLLYDGLHPAPIPTGCSAGVLQLGQTEQPIDHLHEKLACPVRPSVLMRAIAAALNPSMTAIGGGWSMDTAARCLVHEDVPAVALTEKECALLKTLAIAYPSALSRDVLLAEVWGFANTIDTHTLETHLYRLRNKLSALLPTLGDIITEASTYRLRPAAESI